MENEYYTYIPEGQSCLGYIASYNDSLDCKKNLKTPEIDFDKHKDLDLSFDFYDFYCDNVLSVFVELENEVIFIDSVYMCDYYWQKITLPLPDLAGKGRIVFQAYCESQEEIYYFIDNIEIRALEKNSTIIGENFSKKNIELKVLNNYPNPFENETSFRLLIPEAGTYSFQVYNIMGERVSSQKLTFQSPGQKIFRYQGDSLPSGCYLYVLRSQKESVKGLFTVMK